MVGVMEIVREFEIPRATLYRLVDEGHVPVHEVSKSWHQRRQYRFRVSEVRDALDKLGGRRKVGRPPKTRPAP